MTESVDNQLSVRRFKGSKESNHLMQHFREVYRELNKKNPAMQGIGFYGSRTVGLEHTDQDGNLSDLDTIIFYDMVMDPSRPSMDTFKASVRTVIQDEMKKLSLPIHEFADTPIFVNITDLATRMDFGSFIHIVNSYGQKDLGPAEIAVIADRVEVFNLCSRFFLTDGEGVKKNRTYILDMLSREEYGERYFRTLMACLGQRERINKREKHGNVPEFIFPQSIAEARQYFRTGE